jgi:oligopeptide transport system ATP-binding protein
MAKEKIQIDYSQKVLEIQNLQQHFKTGFGKRKIINKAVDGVTFDVYKREWCCCWYWLSREFK